MSSESTKDIKYEKNFLSNVVFRLDFVPNTNVSESSAEIFRQRIKEHLPLFEKNNTIELSTTFKDGDTCNEKKEFPIFIYMDNDKTKKIVLTHKFLSVEFMRYENFNFFKDSLQHVVNNFNDIFSSTDFTRLGLRYINQIVLEKGNPFIWKEYINPSLTNVVDKFFEQSPSLSRTMTQTILNKGDYKINFNYGFFNSEFPAKIRRKEFVLDYDCYTEYATMENITTNVDLFHKEISLLFEKSIKGGLRRTMGVKN